MKRSSKKLPQDSNQRAAAIALLSTEEPTQTESVKSYLAAIGRKGGLSGGKARAKKLSSRRKKEIAAKAAKRRWELYRIKTIANQQS
jgi:hypothetical protein